MQVTRTLALSLTLVAGVSALGAQDGVDAPLELRIGDAEPRRVELVVNGEVLVTSPPEGLWSVATAFADGWPSAWVHAGPERVETVGEWTVLHGALALEGGRLELRDAYRLEGDRVRCVRRFTWRGAEPLARCALSVRWSIPGAWQARPLLPGISYYGNPSGARHPERVPVHTGAPGVPSLYEEHRYPMPFACLEWARGDAHRGAALHTLPSQPAGARYADQWWSLGFATTPDGAELLALSGPVATNGRRNVVKAQQSVLMDYPAPWVTLRPGTVIEKTFHLQAFSLNAPGTAFAVPVKTSIDLHRPFGLDGLPSYAAILDQKLR